MSYDPSSSPGEKPVREPEIIPPSKGTSSPFGNDPWMSSGSNGGRRIYIARLGPAKLFWLVLFAGLVAALLIVLLIGAVLLWLPILALFALGGIVAALVRKSFRLR